MVVDVVFVIFFARGDEPKFSLRIGGSQEAHFARGMAVDDQEQPAAAARAFDIHSEALVGFFVEQDVGVGRGIGKSMTVEAVRALGERVFDDVEEVAAVGRPGYRGYAFGAEGKELPA